jgi:4-hydroxyacetophenone monooxygenase
VADDSEGNIVTDTVANADADATAPADNRLEYALREANLPTLLLVLTQLTGDDRWLEEPYRPRRGRPLDDNNTGGLPEDVQDRIRQAAVRVIRDYRAGMLAPLAPTPERVAQMLEVALVEKVPREYGPLLAEEMGLVSRDVAVRRPGDGFRVLIIGAGISGLCAAIKLRQAGIDYTVFGEGCGGGGNLVGEHLSGVRRGHAEPSVLLRLRAEHQVVPLFRETR